MGLKVGGRGWGISGKAHKRQFTVLVTESEKREVSRRPGDIALLEHQTSKVALKNTSFTPVKRRTIPY